MEEEEQGSRREMAGICRLASARDLQRELERLAVRTSEVARLQ